MELTAVVPTVAKEGWKEGGIKDERLKGQNDERTEGREKG
jgi:hypothetical protein